MNNTRSLRKRNHKKEPDRHPEDEKYNDEIENKKKKEWKGIKKAYMSYRTSKIEYIFTWRKGKKAYDKK